MFISILCKINLTNTQSLRWYCILSNTWCIIHISLELNWTKCLRATICWGSWFIFPLIKLQKKRFRHSIFARISASLIPDSLSLSPRHHLSFFFSSFYLYDSARCILRGLSHGTNLLGLSRAMRPQSGVSRRCRCVADERWNAFGVLSPRGRHDDRTKPGLRHAQPLDLLA